MISHKKLVLLEWVEGLKCAIAWLSRKDTLSIQTDGWEPLGIMSPQWTY